MQAVRFIVSRHGGQLRIQGRQHDYPPDCRVVTGNDAAVGMDVRGGRMPYFDVQAADFRAIYPDVLGLLDEVPQGRFLREPVRIVGADRDVLGVVLLLAESMPVTLLRFTYVYCLGVDRHYFSALLRHSISGDQAFSDFIQANYLNQWSVVRFAEAFDMPLRKFNILFQDMYGMTAKRWLLEQRLQHARGLLLSTPMRVLDIALECGFSNHAHFTDSFRRRFHCNPRQFRLRAANKPCTDYR